MIKRILFLAPTGQIGGAERCLVDTVWSLGRDYPGIEKVMVCGSDGPLVGQLQNENVTVEILAFPKMLAALGDSSAGGSRLGMLRVILKLIISIPAMLIYVIRLRRNVDRHKPDIVHVLGLKMQLLSLAAVPRRTPIVWNVQDYIGQRAVVCRAMKMMMAVFGRVRRIAAGCCSDDVCHDLAQVMRRNEIGLIATVYNSIDTSHYQPDGPVHEVLKECHKVRLGLVSTYARWKGHDLFIQALARLKRRHDLPEWHGFIIGGPIYATQGSQWSVAELEGLAEGAGVSECLTFMPFQDDPSQVMRGLDILVHASTKPEPFGRVIAEGQACGCAVIAVNSGGSAEVFEDQVTGLGFELGNAEALADVMAELILNKSLRESLSEQAIEWSAIRFHRAQLGQQWMSLYLQTIAIAEFNKK